MKKILLFLNGLLLCSSLGAQLPVNTNNTSPVKLSDVVEQYKQYQQQHPQFESDDADNPEGKDYFFNRWLWYWKQHLDQDGNMVSPLKNWQEWETYKANEAMNSIAAKTTKTTNNNSQWVFEGPDSSGAGGKGVGRINRVAFHPTDPNTYWVASPGGGAWKTTNNGLSWTCMTDQNPLLGVSDIVINPLNPNTIYLCTGDVDGGDYYSIGVLKSHDGGNTWAATGLQWTTNNLRQANSMVINPLDTNTLILAASDGLRRSTDGGTTWATTLGGNFKQVLYHPTDTNILYATSYIDPSNISGNAEIFRSANGGATWAAVSSIVGATRIALAVTSANVAVVKAIAAKISDQSLLGVYTSTDTGNTFVTTYRDSCANGSNTPGFKPNLLGNRPRGTDCTYGQGWYDLCIAISPANANDVYVGGVNTWQSTNGGTSWTTLNQWTGGAPGSIVIHADKHCLKFHPLEPNRLFETNDGGVYWADNPASNGIWNNATNGLGITEFYRVAISNIATYEVAGAQDVGCKYVQNSKYTDVNGGDGMECQMDFADSTIYYVESEYGYINRNTIAGNATNISNNIPYLTGEASAAGWVTPYIIEPTCHTCLLAGYQRVYRSTNEGNSWVAMSTTALTTNSSLLRVVTTLADSNTVYALEDGSGTLYFTHNAGSTWASMGTHFSGMPSDIVVDPHNKSHFWITYSGYNTGASVAEFDSSNTTSVPPYWKSLKYNLPNVPVNCIAIDTNNMNLYIGTDVGVFYKDPTMSSWQAYNTGMPVVRVNDIKINYTTNEVWVATYGRSLWKSPKQGNILGVSIVPFALNSLMIAPNPNSGSFTIKVSGDLPDNDVTVRLMDMTGRIAWSHNTTINNSKILISSAGIASGTYIVEVSNSNTILGRSKIVIY